MKHDDLIAERPGGGSDDGEELDGDDTVTTESNSGEGSVVLGDNDMSLGTATRCSRTMKGVAAGVRY